MIILHAAPIVWQSPGGLRASIPALISAQNHLDGVDAALAVTATNPGKPPGMDFPIFHHNIRLTDSNRLNLPGPFDRPQIVVFHSTYIPAHAMIAARLRKARIPYVICPRGGMTRYAQRYRRWKKSIANLLFFNKMVTHAAAVNCLTQGEADASRNWNRPLFVAGNGIHVPPQAELASPGRSTALRFVFIGRLHLNYKGLDALLRACKLVRSELLQAAATIELYGPDCHGSTNVLAGRIARFRLEDVVSICEPVDGDVKAYLLKHTDVFLHPSRSEGHPMAVLEALAHGVPCLVTPSTNMAEDITAAGAGWKVEPSPEGIAAGIQEILRADRSTLQKAGANARRLAIEKYHWGKMAARAIEAYRNCAA